MKTLLLLTLLACLLTFDACLTERRMREKGIEVELNPVIRFMAHKLGATMGSFLGLVVPNAILFASLAAFEMNYSLTFLAGMRSMLAIGQIASLKQQ